MSWRYSSFEQIISLKIFYLRYLKAILIFPSVGINSCFSNSCERLTESSLLFCTGPKAWMFFSLAPINWDVLRCFILFYFHHCSRFLILHLGNLSCSLISVEQLVSPCDDVTGFSMPIGGFPSAPKHLGDFASHEHTTSLKTVEFSGLFIVCCVSFWRVFITGGPGIHDPCEREPTDVLSDLSAQQADVITHSAQVGPRHGVLLL